MGKGGGRKLIAGLVAWAAVAAVAVVASASPAGAAPSRSPIRFWGPNVSYTGVAGDAKKIHAMEKLGNVLYVGGNFDQIAPEPATTNNNGVAGVAQPHLYAVDATTGAYLPQFAPQLNGPVFALELDPATGTLYVGGTFTTVNGQSVTGLAALDTTTGALKGTQRSLANTGGAPGAYALHLVGRQLYVGGQFTNVGGVAKGQIAKLSVDAANPVDPAFQSYLREGKVLSLSNDATKLIVAGEFDALQTGPGGTDVAGTRFLGAVALDTGTTVTTFIPNVPCPGTCTAETRGRSVTVTNGIVFAAFGGNWGRFGAYRATDGAQLAMWDVSGDAQAVATSGNTVFVGRPLRSHHQPAGRPRSMPRLQRHVRHGGRHQPAAPAGAEHLQRRPRGRVLHRRPRGRRHLLGGPPHPVRSAATGRRLRRRPPDRAATATSCGWSRAEGRPTPPSPARRATCCAPTAAPAPSTSRGPPRPTTPP